jgi:putative spermidine/putrescine transport system permease protein
MLVQARTTTRPTTLRPRLWLLAMPAVLFLAAFFVAPLLDNGIRSIMGDGGEFTLSRYIFLLTDSFYLRVTAETILLSASVTAICIILGYPVAYFLVRKSGKWAGLIIFLLIAPLLTRLLCAPSGGRFYSHVAV